MNFSYFIDQRSPILASVFKNFPREIKPLMFGWFAFLYQAIEYSQITSPSHHQFTDFWDKFTTYRSQIGLYQNSVIQEDEQDLIVANFVYLEKEWGLDKSLTDSLFLHLEKYQDNLHFKTFQDLENYLNPIINLVVETLCQLFSLETREQSNLQSLLYGVSLVTILQYSSLFLKTKKIFIPQKKLIQFKILDLNSQTIDTQADQFGWLVEDICDFAKKYLKDGALILENLYPDLRPAFNILVKSYFWTALQIQKKPLQISKKIPNPSSLQMWLWSKQIDSNI